MSLSVDLLVDDSWLPTDRVDLSVDELVEKVAEERVESLLLVGAVDPEHPPDLLFKEGILRDNPVVVKVGEMGSCLMARTYIEKFDNRKED